MENKNGDKNKKELKEKFNQGIKNEHVKDNKDNISKIDNIKDMKNALKRSDSNFNLPLISSSSDSIPDSPSRANTSSPPSLSSSVKILPPIWDNRKVHHVRQ